MSLLWTRGRKARFKYAINFLFFGKIIFDYDFVEYKHLFDIKYIIKYFFKSFIVNVATKSKMGKQFKANKKKFLYFQLPNLIE